MFRKLTPVEFVCDACGSRQIEVQPQSQPVALPENWTFKTVVIEIVGGPDKEVAEHFCPRCSNQ